VATSVESLFGFTDQDLAANRDGVLSGRQALRLWLSGGWRALVGPPLAIGGAALALVSDYFLFAAIGLAMLAIGLYLAWRGFAFMADGATVDIAFVTGLLSREMVRGKTTSYFAEIGPIRKRVSKKTFDALPIGSRLHLYYAPGCRSLLSAEPAAADEPRPAHPFGADSSRAWDRLRVRWVVLTVAIVGLIAAGHIVVDAHPARPEPVSGIISDFYETHSKRGTTEHLVIDGNYQRVYVPSHGDAYTPPIDSFQSLVLKAVVLYVNSGTDDVIALRESKSEVLHAGDYYLHPEYQFYWTLFGGGSLGLLSLLVLGFAAIPLLRVRWKSTSATAVTPQLVIPPTVRALHLGWSAGLTVIALTALSLVTLGRLADFRWGGAPDFIGVVAALALVGAAAAALVRYRARASRPPSAV
jgi:hypothetical protein